MPPSYEQRRSWQVLSLRRAVKSKLSTVGILLVLMVLLLVVWVAIAIAAWLFVREVKRMKRALQRFRQSFRPMADLFIQLRELRRRLLELTHENGYRWK